MFLFMFIGGLVTVQCLHISKDSDKLLEKSITNDTITKPVILADRDGTKGIRKSVYDFNHPPSVDEYASIPVEVVFDNVDNITPKSISTISSTTIGHKESTNTQTTDKTIIENSKVGKTDDIKLLNKPERIILEANFKVPSTDTDVPANKKENNINHSTGDITVNNKNIKAPRNRNVSQIPVAVVYDSETDKPSQDIQRRPHNVSQTRRTRINRKQSFKNETEKVLENAKIDSVNPVVTIKPQFLEIEAANINKISSTETNVVVSGNTETTTRGLKRRDRQKDPVVPIVESESYLFSHGEFHYSYEGGDGTKAFEKGELREFDNEQTGEAVVGGFSYKDKDGNAFELSYTADENGYRPVGAHLPTPPPIPPAIARALAHLATKTTPEPATTKVTTTED